MYDHLQLKPLNGPQLYWHATTAAPRIQRYTRQQLEQAGIITVATPAAGPAEHWQGDCQAETASVSV